MNEEAIETEEQIISLFQEQKTFVYEGWILKMYGRQLWIYPLYHISDGDIDGKIRICEKISRYESVKCVFRIAEYTNYYLRSRLTEENGYFFKGHTVMGELNLTDKNMAVIIKSKEKNVYPNIPTIQKKDIDFGVSTIELTVTDEETAQEALSNKAVGRMWMDTLFLFDGRLLNELVLWNVLQFAVDNKIKKILINLTGCDSLPKMYEEYGFQKSYLCYCYEKQEEKNEFTE